MLCYDRLGVVGWFHNMKRKKKSATQYKEISIVCRTCIFTMPLPVVAPVPSLDVTQLTTTLLLFEFMLWLKRARLYQTCVRVLSQGTLITRHAQAAVSRSSTG